MELFGEIMKTEIKLNQDSKKLFHYSGAVISKVSIRKSVTAFLAFVATSLLYLVVLLVLAAQELSAI